MPPPPVYNSHYPHHPHKQSQDYYSAGWHVDNTPYPARDEYRPPVGQDTRQYTHQVVSNMPTAQYYQSVPMDQPNDLYYYGPAPPPGPAPIPRHDVQGQEWHRPNQQEQRWGGEQGGRQEAHYPNIVRSSIVAGNVVNEQVSSSRKERAGEWQRAEEWTVANGERPHNSTPSCSSSNTTVSSSSTTPSKGLTRSERSEYTALIKDLWRSARFAQEFKKYSVGDFVRVRELLDRIPTKDHRPL